MKSSKMSKGRNLSKKVGNHWIRRSVEYADTIVDVRNSDYAPMLRCCTRDSLSIAIYSFMMLQALHVEIEMKNLNLQVTLLVKKGVFPHQKGCAFEHFQLHLNVGKKRPAASLLHNIDIAVVSVCVCHLGAQHSVQSPDICSG